jgi:hypothetical protein
MGSFYLSPVWGIGNFIPLIKAEKDILTNHALFLLLPEAITIDKNPYTTKRVLYRSTAFLFLYHQIYS